MERVGIAAALAIASATLIYLLAVVVVWLNGTVPFWIWTALAVGIFVGALIIDLLTTEPIPEEEDERE